MRRAAPHREHSTRDVAKWQQAFAASVRTGFTLWNELRGNRLCGVPVRRQYPVDRFALDFYCASRKLAIEVDGEIHHRPQDQDQARTEALAIRGIRFRDDEVLNRLESVLQRLRTEMGEARTEAAD